MTSADTEKAWSAPEVCAYASVSYRNLDYWIRCGYVDLDHPETMRGGSGAPRKFTEADAKRFALMHRLVVVGFRVTFAADIVRRMQHENPLELAPGLSLRMESFDG